VHSRSRPSSSSPPPSPSRAGDRYPVALQLAPKRRLRPWEWVIPLALLNALFLAFVAVQLAVLFGGHEHVLKTTGLTYAEYARSGFWQLLGAAGLTLFVIGAAVLVAETPRRSQRLLLRAVLGLLGALTIVVLVSALRRLLLYEDAFGLTRLRLLAEAVALWLGGLFALVGAAGLVPFVRRHLSRIAVAGTGAALLAFSLADPDRLVAAHNVARWQNSGRLDVPYLQELGADAAPSSLRPCGARRSLRLPPGWATRSPGAPSTWRGSVPGTSSRQRTRQREDEPPTCRARTRRSVRIQA
jgi:hypothetical protein